MGKPTGFKEYNRKTAAERAPELRILDDDLWSAVKARQEKNKVVRKENGDADLSQFNTRRRPKYLFSGLTKCSCCGGGYSAISATLIGRGQERPGDAQE